MRLALFDLILPTHVKRLGIDVAISTKAARVSYRELMPPFLRYAKAERVRLPGSIAVTFGTFSKLFDRTRAFLKSEIRSSLVYAKSELSYRRSPRRFTTSW
jgi:hypothetical protein